jgi:Sensors of blue-light using FAD
MNSAIALRSIVYVSTAVKPMPEAELESLLIEARGLNLEAQVTGVLLYADGNFMQCFEGSEESMQVTYDRIRASKRHTGIIELLNESVSMRSFEDWFMGYRLARKSELLSLSTAQWRRQAGAAIAPKSESSGLELLKQFWHQAT